MTLPDPQQNVRVVLYTSYPKTGSTFLPSLVARLGEACPGYETETFIFGKSKNNLRLRSSRGQTVYQLKTHHTVEDFFYRARAERNSEVPALRKFMSQGVVALGDGSNALIYSVRNPFATLASAIQYSKLVYARESEPAKWLEDGRSARFFLQLLGMKSIPDIETLRNFNFLDLPTNQIEDICWRYVDSRGSIPFLETDGMPTYFEHVNHHQALLDRLNKHCLLTYERLMSGDEGSLTDIGGIIGVPAADLQVSLDAEAGDREDRSGRYTSPFFATFQVSTPPRIEQLPTWRQIRGRTLALCPSLAITLPASV